MDFDQLQGRLQTALSLNTPGSVEPHVCVALPSFSVGESLLSHYADRIPPLEHRYLLASLMLHRIEGCEMYFLSSVAPCWEAVEHYVSLVPAHLQASMRRRLHIVEVPDRSARPIAAKLLDRPALLAALRRAIGDRPAFIEPWNVTVAEVEVALRLGVPINGTRPELWHLGFKSEGRKLFRAAGVPVPVGREDVRTVSDVAAAIDAIRAEKPGVRGVVVKHDNSGAGDGNVVIGLGDLPAGDGGASIRSRVEALPGWYRRDLLGGGVVEELITGADFASPSVQLDIRPDGNVVVLATHEQLLGGCDGQVYTGCRFPADPIYASRLATYGRAVGDELARRGAMGRVAIDFAAAREASGEWSVYALEVNLRKGGTTHPFSTLRHLVPGRYDAERGLWCSASDGRPRWYRATDNMVDPAWTGRDPRAVIEAVAAQGLRFDHARGAGVVLHMLSCLAVDGRFGVTAIGRSAEEAEQLHQATAAAVDAMPGYRVAPA